jgi:glucose/arabinose dehydrogenase
MKGITFITGVVGKCIITVVLFSVLMALAACTYGAAYPNTTAAPSPSTIKVEDFITNLDVPWEMVFTPDGRIFVTERQGKILVIKDGKLQAEPWMNVDVAAIGVGGLLGMALDPDFI